MEMRYSKTYDFYHEGGKTTDYQNKKNKARREDPEYREMERLYALKNNILFSRKCENFLRNCGLFLQIFG